MNSTNINVAVLGAAGYTGEELIRLLLNHPYAKVYCVTSREHAGKSVGTVFPRFHDLPLKFIKPDIEKIAEKCEVAFLCLPHGLAAEFALPLFNKGVKVFDISADFRLKSKELYRQYYKEDHPAPELLDKAVYGLPEKNRDQIKTAKLIACPGCYPTSAILPLYPLLKENVIHKKGITICGLSGVTGAGRKAMVPYLFSECNESIRAYSTFGHRHIPEIEQELNDSAGEDDILVNFSAHLIPVNRGLHSTIHTSLKNSNENIDFIHKIYRDYYEMEPFIRVLPPGNLPDTKHITYSNLCEIGLTKDLRTGTLTLTSAIDNLTKGASGQAIQCMNIACGFKEIAGLKETIK